MIQIVTVQPGDSVYTLAQRYGTTVDQIFLDNGLSASITLVIGQSLLVNTPGNVYYVQPGDSLYKIALTYNTSIESLVKANNLSENTQLQVGQRLSIPKGKKYTIESIAYLQPTSIPISENLLSQARAISPMLTYLAYFSFEVKRDGTLKEPTSLDSMLEIARQNRVIPMLVMTNLENGSFSKEVTSILFNNPTIQNKFITNIIQTAQKYEMRDVHFDFENVDPKDKFPYNEFLRNLKARLPKGYTLSTTVFSKTHPSQPGELFDAYDYRVHGAICDFVIIMTYDWGWQGGPPMAVSPIGAVREVVQFAKTRMPKHKIMVGQNLYGFDWTLPFKPGNPPAKAVSSVSAIALARAHNVPIQYDYKVQACTFKYYDKNGHQHEVWFEDSRSVQATMNLIKEEDVRGISYWKIGLMFPQNPRLLVENFNIVKKV